MGQDSGEAVRGVVVEPGIDGIRMADTQQPADGDRMRGQAVGDLQQGGAAFTDIRACVVVPVAQQFVPLRLR
jgi:hypothetical protein